MVGLEAIGYVVAVINGGCNIVGWTLETMDVLKGHLHTTPFSEDYEVGPGARVTAMTRSTKFSCASRPLVHLHTSLGLRWLTSLLTFFQLPLAFLHSATPYAGQVSPART